MTASESTTSAPSGALRMAVATAADIAQIQTWAADEGWNPGHGDAAVALDTDPAAYTAGYIGERLVSAVSVVNYGNDFAFCGTLLVAPDLRGQGIGTYSWEAAIGRVGGRTVGADIPADLAEKARRLGFIDGFKILRFVGQVPPAKRNGPQVIPLNANEHSRQLATLDAACFPARRPRFAAAFATAPGHHTLVYTDANGNVRGYGVLRLARGMARIGPLYAERSYHAACLFDALCTLAGEVGAVTIGMDVPAQSKPGLAIALTRGMSGRGEAHRMYRPGTAKLRSVDFEQLCAISCMGLG